MEVELITNGCALVVGGSGGIGEAICAELAFSGLPVVVGYRSRGEHAAAVVDAIRRNGGRASEHMCDLTDRGSIAAFVKHGQDTWGTVRSAVMGSGPNVEQSYTSSLTDEQVLEVYQSDVMGFLRLAQAVIPVWRMNGGGSLVALSSIAVHRFPKKDILGGLPKSGVEMLCRALAKEEGRYNIRVNSVAPGFIEAGLGKKYMDELYSPEVWDRQRRETPLGRFGKAAEIATVVSFLVSEKASFMTGQNLVVDGGFGL